MKKTIVAISVCAVALFATLSASRLVMAENLGSAVDDIVINVAEVCTFSRQANPHTNPEVSGESGTWSSVDAKNDMFSAMLVAGTSYAGIATSAYNVTCNNATNAYQVTVETTPFTGVAGAGAWEYVAANEFKTDDSSWFLTSSAKLVDEDPSKEAPIENGGAVWTSEPSTPITSSDFVITYSIRPSSSQKIGTYTASATYTLANL